MNTVVESDLPWQDTYDRYMQPEYVNELQLQKRHRDGDDFVLRARLGLEKWKSHPVIGW